MSVLVTGGAGYIGTHTCVELLNSGYDVVVVDNFCNSSPKALQRVREITQKDTKLYDIDVCGNDELCKVFEENEIDAVIHFAGLKAVGESCKIPLEYYRNNVYGTLILCECMKKYGVKKIVFSSSATVYGHNPVPYVETMSTGDVSNPYGRTKHIIEQMLFDLYNSDNEWSIALLRYFNPIGAHSSGLIGEDPMGIPNNLLPYILKVAVGKLPYLPLYGDDYDTPDGTCIRDYLHVVDLAVAHLKALERIKSYSGIDAYNIGTGTGYSVFDIIKSFESSTGIKINYHIKDRRSGDVPIMCADVHKAYEILGWSATHTLEEMCRDSWNWQKNNPDGYK